MKTLVITASETPLPGDLDEMIRRGSTAVEHRRASDVAPAAPLPDVDRVVFWSAGSDPHLRSILDRFVSAERKARAEVIVFVSTVPGDAGAGLAPAERFVWPQDKD